MALSDKSVWEVRTTGNDNNGGAFVAGSTGTDRSQQDAPHKVFTDLVIGATDTELTSAANSFVAADVGNTVYITGGTGFTVGAYQILSVTSGVATMDRAVGTAASTGGTGNLGGALLTLAALAARMVSSNRAFLKSGTYSVTSAVTFAQPTITLSHTVTANALIGYHVTRGDLGPYSALNANRPRIQVDATIASAVLLFSNVAWNVRNIEVANGSGTHTISFTVAGGYSQVTNCKVSGASTRGIHISGSTNTIVAFCEATGCSANTGAISAATGGLIYACHVHDNTGTGIYASATHGCVVDSCVVVNNTGGSSDGVYAGSGTKVLRCTIHGNGRDGIRFTHTGTGAVALGNILSENAGYGINASSGPGTQAMFIFDGNAYYDNGVDDRNNLDDTGAVNPVNGFGAYTNTRDLTLTVSPFVDVATDDYTLNTTAGGGLDVTGTSVPVAWPGLAIVGHSDLGAVGMNAGAGGGTAPTVEQIATRLLANPANKLYTSASGHVVLQDASLVQAKFGPDITTGPTGGDSAGVTTLLARNTEVRLAALESIAGIVSNLGLVKTETDKIAAVKTETDKIASVKTGTDKLTDDRMGKIDTIQKIHVGGTVGASPTPTTTAFVATGADLSTRTGAHEKFLMIFTSGVNVGELARRVSGYTVASGVKTFTTEAWPNAPAATDTFILVGRKDT